ncbi:YcxB family protein [Rhizobium sp. BR 314]|uniref:YcxB family protein n=1 Tax=Rhizobium sp. BR 314 TaxID=3040013 RepID=UPI0039BF328D
MQNSAIKVTYTEDIVRDAVRTFVWRRGILGQKRLWVAEVVMIALLLWNGDRGWVAAIMFVIILLPPAMIAVMWVAHHRNTVGKFHRMRTPRAELTFRDEGLDVVSDLGLATIHWSTITEIWERPAYWMIFIGPNQFFTLPLETLSPADRDFLRSKVACGS